MPAGDGTGPAGFGPMTGRAAGLCVGYPVPGYMNFYGGRLPYWGFGPGRGRGRGRGWWGMGFGRGRGRGFGRWGAPAYPPYGFSGPYAVYPPGYYPYG